MSPADVVDVVNVFLAYVQPYLTIVIGVGITLWVGGAVWQWVRGRS